MTKLYIQQFMLKYPQNNIGYIFVYWNENSLYKASA